MASYDFAVGRGVSEVKRRPSVVTFHGIHRLLDELHIFR